MASEEDLMMPDDPTSNDAEWKKIQQNTFTRWCNEHLKCANLYIYNLESDLCDGLKLIALLQVLSHKKIRRYNKKPTFRPQKIENIAIALKFIEDENIKLVNIDASDILKGNLKLILGLIWTLILKYQISLPMMDDDDEEASNITPKQALMGWVKSKLPPEVRMNNFNKDWNNGVAIGALVDAVAPGLFPDWEDLDPADKVKNAKEAMDRAQEWLGIPQVPVKNFHKDWNDGIAIASLVDATAPGLFSDWDDLLPENALDNAREAMKRAEDWLGVPQVITPEEITNENVDELSVMTYVSYFPEAKLKPGAPLKPKMTSASKCSASGPGIQEHGNVVHKPADFTIFSSGSSKGKINVQVLGPGRQPIDCMVQDNQDNTYSCQYTPPKEGVYDVHIRVGGHHIPKSPFRVNVASDLDTSKVIAQGPGLEPHGVIVGRPAPFEVIATNAGSGKLAIDVIDPKGNKKTELKVKEKGDNVFDCEYLPQMVGRYVIVIKYGGKEVGKSPYHVNVIPAAGRVKIYGPGLEPGLKTGKPASFTIDCKEAGEGPLDVTIEGPGRNKITPDIVDNGDGTYTCTYKPIRPGQYTISVKFDKTMVPQCPVKVAVGTSAEPGTRITASGPGLERGVAGRPAEFYVTCRNAPTDNVGVTVDGPGEAKVEQVDNGDGKITVRYYPTVPGKYIIHVKYEDVDIKDSPYAATISPRGNVSKVYAKGPGLEDGNMAGKPCEFTVFTKDAGVRNGSVQVTCVSEDDGEEVECRVKDNGDGTFTCTYYPKNPGNYKIDISFMDEPIPQSPITVKVLPFSDASKVRVYGPGLSGGKVKKPAKFDIDATKAGEGGIGVTIEGPTETEIKCDDHGDGTCSVEYMPIDEGEYKINVLFADQHVPGSTFTAIISDEFDASKVKVDGPGLKPGNKAGKPCVINIDTTKAGKAKLFVEVLDEENNPVRVELVEDKPGKFTATYFPTKEGDHTVNVTFGGKHVPKSPIKVKINPSGDASKVKVYGPGVEPTGVKSNEKTYFEVDATNAGDGEVDIKINPSDKNMPEITDIEITEGKKPNTYVVKYVVPKPGDYTVNVRFAGHPVPKSPFNIKVTLGVDASKCRAYGPGIESPIVSRENLFTVDVPKEAGDAPLTVVIESPTGKKIKVKPVDNGKGGFDVAYKPDELGPHKINVKYGDQDIPGSTFLVDVLNEPDASKVKAYGPGLEGATIKEPSKFTVDTKEAGPGDLSLHIEGPEEVPMSCTDNGDGTCTVEYTPNVPGEYDVDILFDGQHIPKSPFKVPAGEPFDISKVKCKGPGVDKKVPASFPAEFTVDATKTGKAPVSVDVTGPDGKKYPCDVKDNGDKTFDCSYVPDKKGPYKVEPKYGGKPVPGAPFNVKGEPTGDASKVKCTGPGLERPHVGHPAPFEVDTTKAGKGKLNVNAKGPDGEPIPVNMTEDEDGIYAVEYTPEELGPHEVEVLFGGNPVPGSPFKANATPSPEVDKVKAPVLEELLEAGPCVEQQFEAPVDCSDVPDHQEAILTGKITPPSGKKEPVDVTDNHDGTFALNYTPKEVGKYVLDVGYDGIPIPGSPFEFEVTEGGPDKVNVYGKGIKKGVVAVPARFTVDTKNAGPGDLSVAVEGPSKVDIECVDNGDGTCDVTYVPVEPGDYDVIVKFDNQPVPGSPFKPTILQDEPAVEVGRPSDLCMKPEGISPKDIPRIKGVLESPSGKQTPVDVKEGPDDSIMATFVPEEEGKNKLHLKKNNKPIDGSPVPVLVREKPVIGEDSKIPLESPDCDLPNDIPKMKGILTRPNGKDEPCDVKEGPDETIAVSFVPEEPGKHLITVLKDDKQVEDSPFVVTVEGTPDQYPHVGDKCDKNFYQPEPVSKTDIDKMVGTLRRPTGKEEPVDVKLGPDDTIAVSFVPTEAGEHLVSVKKDGRHVPHSPFSIMVIDEPTMPTVGSDCAANFDIPDIDLPNDLKYLTGTLTSPDGKEEPLDLSVGPDNTLAVNFVPKMPGKHIIGIKKRGKHVKDSPFEIMVGEAKPKSQGPTVGQDCTANLPCTDLDLPKDLKDLTGEVERPNGKKDKVDLSSNPDGTLDVAFTPKEPGEHLIHVAKKGKPIKDSPFPIMVEDGEPSGPTVGRECDVNLDIPELTLPKDLPAVKAELTKPNGEKEPLPCSVGPDDTLAVAFTPTEPGTHLIDVKKRGRPVKGSPFEVNVAPAVPDGIDEEIVPQIDGDVESAPCFPDFPEFLDKDQPATLGKPCDSILGDIKGVKLPDDLDKLDAVVTSPSNKKEPANCEMAPDGTLAVAFTPKEPGTHMVDVKKSGKPVEGSPFPILVEEQPEDKPKVGDKCDLGYDIPGVNLPEDLDKLKAVVTAPSGNKKPIPCTTTPDDTLGLEFTPEEPGKHIIDVTKDGKPVEGSPFEIDVEAPNPKVGDKCDLDYDIPGVKLPDDLKDLKAVVTAPSGKKEPIPCTTTPDDTLGLEFTPEEPGKHLIDVTKKGKPVEGSPFVVDVDEPTKPKVGDKCDLDYDIPGVKLPDDLKDLKAVVTTPSGKKEPIPCTTTPDDTLGLEFTPEEPGKHIIDVTKRGKPVEGSPFEIDVEEEDKPKPKVGDKLEADYDIPGVNLPKDLPDLKANVTSPSGKKQPIPCSVTPDNTLGLEFTPEEPGKHIIDVTKRGKPVEGSPFEIIVEEEDKPKPKVGDKLEADYDIPGVNLPRDLPDLKANVTSPSGKKQPIPCSVTPDNTLGLEFTPEEPGKHIIDVTKRGKPVEGSPFEIIVEEEDKPKPKVGDKLEADYDIPGVDLPKDLPNLKANVTSPSGKKQPIPCSVTPDNTLGLEFTPEEPGKHIIDVTKRGKPVEGSPFEIIVEEEDKPKPKVGDKLEAEYDIPGVDLPKDLPNLKANVTSPSGKKQPIPCSVTPDNTLGLEFTPEEPGKHIIDVTKRGKPVEGSPFEIIVEEEDKPKPKVGDKLEADYDIPGVDLPKDLPNLKANVTSPSGKKQPIPCSVTPDNTLGLEFTPEEPGKHIIDVTKRGKPVEGSPFEIIVEEEDKPKPKVGDKLEADYDIPGVNLPKDLPNLKANVTSPSGKKQPIPCSITPDNTLGLEFTPEEPGKHIIDVTKRGKPVEGSPFEIIIEEEDKPKPKVGDKLVADYDIPGVNLPKDLPNLKANVTSPSGKKQPIPCNITPDNTLGLEFTPEEPGKHIIDVTKRGKPVEGSPFEVIIEPDTSKPTVGNPCEVDYDIPDIKLPQDLKDIKVNLQRPSGKKEPVEVTITPENTLGLEFTPTEPGKHTVNITKRDKPVKGSPFEIIVEEDQGPGSTPTVGHRCDVDFDIPGVNLPTDLKLLKAKLQRPDKTEENIPCNVSPDNTLALEFTPKQPGEHKIFVTKDRKPVPGSPFSIIVEPEKPENKPTVGIKCDFDFNVPDVILPDDLKHLKAKLTRPNGVEENVKCVANPDNTLGLEFTPKEPGKHVIQVTKHGKPVKGSPFIIMVEEDTSPGTKPTVGIKCDIGFDLPDVNLKRDLKDLKATLKRPSGKKEPIECKITPDDTLGLEFTPEEPGKHVIDVTKRGKPVKGSPFVVIVEKDSSPTSSPAVGIKCDVDFEIQGIKLPDDLKNLKATLTRPSGEKEPLECTCTPDNTLGLEFTPKQPGKHVIDVTKNGRPVNGSPFIVMVEDDSGPPSKPSVGIKCDVDFEIQNIDLPNDLKNLKATLSRPSGKKEPLECTCTPDNTLGLEFTPKQPGKHVIDVTKKGKPVNGSPFVVMVEDVTQSKPTVGIKCDVDFDIPDVNLPSDLKNLKSTLTRPSGKKEPLECTCSPDNTLGLEFTPKEPGKHKIDVTKNGRPVKGSPFEVDVSVDEPKSKVPIVGSECDINFEIPGVNVKLDFKNLKGSLKRPGKKTEEPLELKLNPNNTIGVNFVPEQVGRHEVSIKKGGKHVPGSPFDVIVHEISEPSQGPQVGSPIDLSLDITVSELDRRFTKASVTKPDGKEEPLELKYDKKKKPTITFTPDEPGLYKINVKQRNKHLPGSPIEVLVTQSTKKTTCDIGFEIPGIKLPDDLKYLKGSVVSPNGNEEPVDLQLGANNTIVVSFLPKEAGTHYIHIKKNNKPVGDSPYEVIVKPEDVSPGKPDASKVKCTGKGLRCGRPNEKADFVVDTRNAGYGGLGLSVEGPSKVDINCVDNEDGTCSVDYKPTEPGTYLINVTYAEEHVPGSPFKCRISPDGMPIDEEEIVPLSEDGVQEAPGEFSDMLAFPSSKARSPQDFVIKFSGSGDLKASVTRPSGIEDDAEVVETGPDTYTVRFVPRETGEHLVNVKARNRHIPGSPFKVIVEAPAGGAGACKAYGPGLEGGVAGEPCRFTVVTRDAGPGGLAVAVEGPAKAEIQCHDNGDGSCDITWYPVESGDYTVHIRFADEAIPGSPYKVFIHPADEGKAMSMENFKEQVLRIGQQASFAVQMKGKKGNITASVTSPSGCKIDDCKVTESDEGNYAVRFVPRELGDHLVSVFLDGHHIPGSPFTVKVGGLEGDPSKVRAYGPGLKGGIVGKPAEFTVNALDAGSGALALSIDGPAKVKMNCVEQDDGTYKVIYNPTVPGIYEISIRFAGQHIPGSAYKVLVAANEDEMDTLSESGDASMCVPDGLGLRQANIGEPAYFTVDASKAGRGAIMVGVEGPVIPSKEIIVRHTGGNVYSVNYILEEPGDYVLQVLWAGKHIPGSPFHLTV